MKSQTDLHVSSKYTIQPLGRVKQCLEIEQPVMQDYRDVKPS